MKSFVIFAIVLCLAAAVPVEENSVREERSYGAAPPAPSYSAQAPPPSYSSGPSPSYSAPPAPSYSAPPAPAPAAAPAAPAYNYPAPLAPLSIPAPPCPKNYMFSCQPKMTAAPCAQAVAYANAGGYSHNYPVYAPPQYFNDFRPYY